MITVYTMDARGLFIAAIEIDTMGPLPVPLTMTAPPATTGTEVARWDGKAWEVLAERPPLPTTDPTPENVVNAPKTGFGGPTIKEQFNGNF